MQLFRDVINECGFIDMGFKDCPFTWKFFSEMVNLYGRD